MRGEIRTRHIRRTALALALLAPTAAHRATPLVSSAPDASPLVGRWQVNLGRTHYGAGVDRRRHERMTCTEVKEGIHCVIESIRSDGSELTGRFTASLNGFIAPVTGIPGVDRVRLQAPKVSIVDATFFFRGQPAFGYRAFRSDDGRSLMIVSVDPVSRAAGTTVVVYDRR